MDQCDVAIIGGGAAGLSAALVLSRARRDVLVVDAGEPRNAPAAHRHGYLSRDGRPPQEQLVIDDDVSTAVHDISRGDPGDPRSSSAHAGPAGRRP